MTAALIPFPSLRSLIPIVTDAVSSPATKRIYARALARFFDWGPPTFTRATVQAYRAHLESVGASSSTINQSLSAIRLLAREAAAGGMMDQAAANGITGLAGVKALGRRCGRWLSREDARALLAAPDRATLQGKRDAVVLGLLLGCGIRRAELCSLTVGHVQQRDRRWCIVDLVGKRKRVRTVPMPAWVHQDIADWIAAAGIEGPLVRSINQRGEVGPGISPPAVYQILQRYAPGFAPHDMRRSFSRLARAGGAPLDQLQASLGHADVGTTQRYVGDNQDLRDAPCDRLGL